MRYRGWSKFWRNCLRLGSAAVLVTAVALAAGSMPAVAMPTRPASTSFPTSVPEALHSALLTHRAAKVPSGGGSGSSGLLAGVPKPVKEIVADRTAISSTWQNANGTLTVRRYLAPHFYKSASGGWLPVDPVLAPTPGQAGWWHSQAGSFGASFGPAGAAGGAEQLKVGGAQIGFAPLGVASASQAPQVSGATAAYDGLWRGADLTEQVLASGMNEDIVLTSPSARASFNFRLAGATARADGAGGLALVADGRPLGTVPPLTVTTRLAAAVQLRQPDGSPADATMDATTAAGARLSVAGDVLRVSVSPAWLASLPASAFPVVIDPSVDIEDSAATAVSVGSNGGTQNALQLGTDSQGQSWSVAAYIPPPALPPQVTGWPEWQVSSGEFIAECASACNLVASVYGLRTSTFGVPGSPGATDPTYSEIPHGTQLYMPSPVETQTFALAEPSVQMNQYLATWTDGWWFGITASQASEGSNPKLAALDPSAVYMEFYYVEQPEPTTITSPAGNSVLATTTPTLTAAPVTDQTTDPSEITSAVDYDFRISASSDGAGTLIDSGWQSGTNWTVPPGSLQNGVTYYATVLDSLTVASPWDPAAPDYVPPAAARPSSSFTIQERLGAGGPSPTDTVGSSPQGTGTPSQGAPSPGAGTASETVNMVTGDLSVAVGTPQMQALAGPAGVTLSYDSLVASAANGSGYGLTGRYYPDDGTHSFDGALAGQRTDSNIDMQWLLSEAPISGLGAGSPFMTRWTGVLTLPSGTNWALGGVTSGGMRISLNGSSVYDDWAGTTIGRLFGTTLLAGGQQYQIEVDDWEPYSGASQPTVQLWAENANAVPTDPQAVLVVPSSWLTPVATGLPAGWSLLANASTAQWTSADDQGSQVVLQAPGGDTETFIETSPGVYLPPPGSQDYLSVDGNGHLQLSTSDNELYTFDADGSLASMTTIADDLHPASLQYTYSGSPSLLTSITDPVSGRAITLAYGGGTGCPGSGSVPVGLYSARTGMLCQVSDSGWDGTATAFWYNGNGQLAEVSNSGGQTSSFAYDGDNRLAGITDPLANDYLADGGQAGTPVACTTGTGLSVPPTSTQVCYDSSGRVARVTQPAPTPGAPRPSRTYTYDPASDGSGTTYLQIAGFTPDNNSGPGGTAEWTDYDSQGRVIRQSDSAGHVTTTVWANAMTTPGRICATTCGEDEPIATADPAGEQTTTVYDQFGNVTDIYGPAPVACFSGGWPTGVTPNYPVTGYLPVANPQGTAGCGVPAVPHAHNGYDEGITGLAATYWPNAQSAGAAAMHATGLGAQPQPQSWCGTAGGLCAEWTAGSAPNRAGGSVPIPTDANGNWSLRLTGTITVPANSGAYLFEGDTAVNFLVSNSQPVTVLIDGTPVVSDDPASNSTWNPGGQNNNWTDNPISLSPGPHTIEVDFQGTTAELSEFSVQYNFAIDKWEDFNTYSVIPNSMLDPGYNLSTSTTDPDGDTTTISYSNSNIGPEYGLPTATTVGAGSSTPLTTTTTYQAPGPGSYLQKTSTTLPAGNTTSFQNYTGTAGPVAAACGVSSTTAQGGKLEEQTDPDPGNDQPLVKQFIYDAEGRQVGVRTGTGGTSGDIGDAPWQCTSYDSRGRLMQETFPAANGSPARTVTYNYSVGGNPLVSSVSDSSGTITSSVDLLGRVTSYTDAWGQTTTTSYDQAGQVTATSGPGGSYQLGYDPNSGQPTTTSVNGTLLATVSYDSDGRMNAVSYGNGTTAAASYDAYGNQDGLSYDGPTGSLLTEDTITSTLAGRESSETASGPGGVLSTVSYCYDAAGRLTGVVGSASCSTTLTSSYSYANNPASDDCAAYGGNPGEGANTNRTSVTTPSGTTDYCYNTADQLVASITNGTPSTGYAYNERGDQTDDDGTIYSWDASDRVATVTTADGTTTTSTYDAVDRLVQSGSTSGGTVRYSYAGYSDAPTAVLNASDGILQQIIPLPGGATVILQPSGNVWSYANLQGDATATANSSGTRTSGPVTYDPWGNLTPGQAHLATTTGPNALGAYATSGKLTNTSTSTILLGARTFSPTEGRFLSVDPVEGGCANPYTYAFGDPLNHPDLTGENVCAGPISASAAIAIGRAIKNGASVADLLGIMADFGIGGEIAEFIAKAVKVLGETYGEAIMAAGYLAESAAKHSGAPGEKEPQVLFVQFTKHIATLPIIGSIGIPIGPPVPIPVLKYSFTPGPNNPRAQQFYGC